MFIYIDIYIYIYICNTYEYQWGSDSRLKASMYIHVM